MHTASHTLVSEGGSVALGTQMHDIFFSSRGGHTFSLCDWSTDVCSSDLIARGAAEGGFYATTVDTAALSAGNYTFDASYTGDPNYNDIGLNGVDDEHFTVNKGTLTLTTVMHTAGHTLVAEGGSVALGTQMHDNALLSGAVPGFAPSGSFPSRFSSDLIARGAAEGGFYATTVDTAALSAGNYTF